jgi:uncharacterized protein (DUF697 family)/uncharacterized tellurite resistance protein B-like protein
MAITADEGLAAIRLLVCMAKADGVLKPDERYNLEDALAGVVLPEGLTIAKLLDETNEPAALAKAVVSSEGRDYAYASVYALAYCDRELAEPEARILKTLRDLWNIQPDEEKALASALELRGLSESAVQASVVKAEAAAREAEFNSLLTRYALVTALTGAIPVPLVPDLMVVPIQVKMVYDVAALFGRKTDKKTVQLMFETLGVGTGARIGISALCKLVPGWGSVVGAASSFATTWALGRVAWAYFDSDGARSIESLKDLYQAEHRRGKDEYQKHKAALDEAGKAHRDTLRQLAYDLQQGKITQAEYQRRLDELQ